MKAKIFNALKTSYSHLGLGDEILQLHAENLASTGLVTDDNLNVIISSQSQYLANLQKLNDRRVNEAVAKTKKDAEDEAAKKKEAEEAAKKAAAEEAAKKKAEEEEARKAEELKKNTEIPDWYKKMLDEQNAAKKEMEEQMKQLMETNKSLSANYEAMKKEADTAKAAAAAAQRQEFILNKAKELGIPQYRIDEGFAFASDATEEAITSKLTTIASNVKTSNLPNRPNAFPITEGGELSSEDLKSIAKGLVR